MRANNHAYHKSSSSGKGSGTNHQQQHPRQAATSEATSEPHTVAPPASAKPLLRIRLIELDSYVSRPDPSRDYRESPVLRAPLSHVPVIRVFGTTPAGQKCTAHVHRCFPYFYVPMPATVPDNVTAEREFMARLAVSLQSAIAQCERNRTNSDAHSSTSRIYIYDLTLHLAIDFYGYHSEPTRFMKIALIFPTLLSLASSILLSGALLGQSFQPYESHIPYTQQFMADANLSGMDWMDLQSLSFREPLPIKPVIVTVEDIRVGVSINDWNGRIRRSKCSDDGKMEIAYDTDSDNEHDGDGDGSDSEPSMPTPMDEFTAIPHSQRLFVRRSLPRSLLAPSFNALPRASHSELELDCSFYHILNRLSKPAVRAPSSKGNGMDTKTRLVQSLKQLWENEKKRRELRSQQRKAEREERRRTASADYSLVLTPMSQLSQSQQLQWSQISSSPPREAQPLSELEAAYHAHLRAVAEQERQAHQRPQPPFFSPANPQHPQPAFRTPEPRRPRTAAVVDDEDLLPSTPRVALLHIPPHSWQQHEQNPKARTEFEENAEVESESSVNLFLRSALLNAQTPLSIAVEARLPAVSAVQSEEPVDQRSPLPMPLLESPEIDDDLLLLSQSQIRANAENLHNEGGEELKLSTVAEEDEELDEVEIERKGEEVDDERTETEERLRRPLPPIGHQISINIDDESEFEQESTVSEDPPVRIPQFDGGNDSPVSGPTNQPIITRAARGSSILTSPTVNSPSNDRVLASSPSPPRSGPSRFASLISPNSKDAPITPRTPATEPLKRHSGRGSGSGSRQSARRSLSYRHASQSSAARHRALLASLNAVVIDDDIENEAEPEPRIEEVEDIENVESSQFLFINPTALSPLPPRLHRQALRPRAAVITPSPVRESYSQSQSQTQQYVTVTDDSPMKAIAMESLEEQDTDDSTIYSETDLRTSTPLKDQSSPFEKRAVSVSQSNIDTCHTSIQLMIPDNSVDFAFDLTSSRSETVIPATPLGSQQSHSSQPSQPANQRSCDPEPDRASLAPSHSHSSLPLPLRIGHSHYREFSDASQPFPPNLPINSPPRYWLSHRQSSADSQRSPPRASPDEAVAVPVSAVPTPPQSQALSQTEATQRAHALKRAEQDLLSVSSSADNPLAWHFYHLLPSSATHALPASSLLVLVSPPPSVDSVMNSFIDYGLLPVIHQQPYFTELSHYQQHVQSSSTNIAVAHYQSAINPQAVSNGRQSLVLPPLEAIDMLPPFEFNALQSTNAINGLPSEALTADASDSKFASVSAVCGSANSRLFFVPPPMNDTRFIYQYMPLPPTFSAVTVSIPVNCSQSIDGSAHNEDSLSPSQSSNKASDVSDEFVIAASSHAKPTACDEEAGELMMRPASPKLEEKYQSTLSYFLPTTQSSKPKSSAISGESKQSQTTLVKSKKRARDEENGDKRKRQQVRVVQPTAATESSNAQISTLTPLLKSSLPAFKLDADAHTVEEAQHLTLFVIEVHCASRNDLLPDPVHDAVCAIVWSARWEKHGTDERRTLHGVLAWPHIPTQSFNGKPQSNQRRDVRSIPFPPLTFDPATIAVRLVTSELALIKALIAIVRLIDPDIVYSYEIQKNGLGYLVERAAQMGVRLDAELSRIKSKRSAVSNNDDSESEAQLADNEPVEDNPTKANTANDADNDDDTTNANNNTTSTSTSSRPSEFNVNNTHSANAAERYAYNHSSGLHVPGRIVLNLWRLMRDELKLNIYTIENVSNAVLGLRIPKFPYQSLTRWWTESLTVSHNATGAEKRLPYTGNVQRVCDYYLQRTIYSLSLIDRLDLIGRTSELSRVFGIKFYNVLDRGSQFRVESMLIRMTKPYNYLLASLSPEQRASQAAMEALQLIMEPISQLYTSPVIVMDFQSLYPSMMIAYNICYSTCLGKLPPLKRANASTSNDSDGGNGVSAPLGGLTYTRSSHLLNDLLSADDQPIWISPSGCMFLQPTVRHGVLPQLLSEILQTRVMVKDTMKRHEIKANHSFYRMLNARQFGLKLISNVTYGYTAAGFSGRMPCAEIADAIVSSARATLERAIHTVESHPRWKAKVVYGDTDSLFIHLEGRTRAEAFVIGNEIAATVTAMNPKPVKLQFEKIYHPCMLVAKKRYVGLKYERPSTVNPVLDAKGIEMVRRDGCPLLVKIQAQAIHTLFTTLNVSRVRQNIERAWKKIYTGSIPIQECIFAKEVRLGTYKVLPQAAVVATNSIKHDIRSAPLYGERVEFVVVDGYSDSERVRDKAVTPQYLLVNSHRLRICASYYIEKQLIPPLQRLFDLMGVSIKAWYAQWPRPRRRLYTPSLNSNYDSYQSSSLTVSVSGRVGIGGKKRTIDHYYQSQHCPLCDQTIQHTHKGFCAQCLSNFPFLTMQTMALSSRVDERVSELVRVCRSCIGDGYIGHSIVNDRQSELLRYPCEIECVSRDCPVYFSRHCVRDELIEAQDVMRKWEQVSNNW